MPKTTSRKTARTAPAMQSQPSSRSTITIVPVKRTNMGNQPTRHVEVIDHTSRVKVSHIPNTARAKTEKSVKAVKAKEQKGS